MIDVNKLFKKEVMELYNKDDNHQLINMDSIHIDRYMVVGREYVAMICIRETKTDFTDNKYVYCSYNYDTEETNYKFFKLTAIDMEVI